MRMLRRRAGLGLALAAGLWMGLAGCYASRTDRADTNTNWVKCDTNAQCSNGEVCQAGMCVTDTRAETAGAGMGGLGRGGAGGSPMQPIGTAGAEPPSSTGGGPGSNPVEPPVLDTFGADGSIVLFNGIASVPYVRYIRDHFEVFYRSGGAPGTFELVHVTPAGVTERFTRAPKDYWMDLIVAFADDGRIAVAQGCGIELLEPDLQGESTLFTGWTCSDDEYTTVVSVPGNGDWLVAFSDADMPQRTRLGRYRPSQDAFIGDPVDLGVFVEFPREQLVAVDGSDALYAVGNAAGASVVRVPGWGAAAFEPPGDDPVSTLVLGSTIGIRSREGGFAFAQLVGATLLFGVDEASTWSTRLDSGSEPLPKHTLAGVSEPGFGPAAVAVPELAGAGVCYATDEGLAIAVVAPDGVPFAGQTTIPVQGTVLRCDIAWSGRAFLVVYTSRSTGSDTVHGQLLAPPQ